MNPRLLNQLFENTEFSIDEASIGYIVRDIINMNWWNTCGVLVGYKNNRRIIKPLTEAQKLVALQLKEYWYINVLRMRDEDKLRHEVRGYLNGSVKALRQLNAFSYPTRMNPSQHFHRKDGTPTWVDCTSRATYAAKYVLQNGYLDFDGKARFLNASDIVAAVDRGECEDLGIRNLFEDGQNQVKEEIFSQKTEQRTVSDWVNMISIHVIPERMWLFNLLKNVRTDPYKRHEADMIRRGLATGVNERLYGFSTSMTIGNIASRASRASRASHESNASSASNASHASNASSASRASRASNAGSTRFTGSAWSDCETAIHKPDHLEYPKDFRKNIFGVAGNWKIDREVISFCKKAWFDPFMGHGTSPLYAKKHGISYVGFDTNKRAFDEYLNIVKDEIEAAHGAHVEMRCTDSTIFDPNLVGKFDLCYTSPPYFNFEEYGGNTSHYDGCESYDDFHTKITVPVFSNVFKYLVSGGVLALQVEKNKKNKNRWADVIESLGFVRLGERTTGGEKLKYSTQSKRDQNLLLFSKL